MPSTPHKSYTHAGWQGYGHWLGIGNLHTKEFLPFKKALLHARSLTLKTHNEWVQSCKSDARDANVPARPDIFYTLDRWQGYGHRLGTSNVGVKKDQQFLPFKKALLYARALKLKGKEDWEAWSKSGARPANIPSAPIKVYKHDGWQGYGHWLGTGNVAPKDQQFLPFKTALLHARSLDLKGRAEWRRWCKNGERAANIPSHPEATYKHEGWQGYGHWLGTGGSWSQRLPVPAVDIAVSVHRMQSLFDQMT